jgi:serine/threonine-protein kinase
MDKYVGKRLDGRYELQEIIGIGGMAVVYKAYDAIDDRTVAVKILKEELLENQEFRRRFKNESKAIAVLSHPNIVKVYDVGLGDRIQYIVMEHIDGITLKEYIKSQQTIRWKDALHFAEQVLKALQHAHDKGIVHRDIKPQNIILLPDGTIKVTDFGIARFSRSEHRTMTDKAIGSVHYISPEQARGEATDEKTDLYSVGVLLYEMLTGRLPFDAENAVSVAIMQLQNEPTKPRELNATIPEGLEEIILRAMQKNRAQRYQSAAEMLKDIEKFKLNPSVQFEYKYFVDSDPTKFVNVGKTDLAKTTPEKEKEDKKKSPVMASLIGVTVAVVVAVILLGLVAAGKIFGFGPFAANHSSATCPDLLGKMYNDVITSEEYKDFTITVESKEYSTEFAAGAIMHQTPEAGKTLKGQKEIVVKVSQGSKSQLMEDYTNYNIAAVTGNLDALGIAYKTVEVFSDEIANGFVVGTIPSAGEPVVAGSEVLIYVSKGATTKLVKVSDYVGMTEEVAKRRIEGDGLTVGKITREESSKYPAGYVIDQSVDKGGTVSGGTAVNLVVSSGSAINIFLPIPNEAVKPFTVSVYYNGQSIYSSGQIDPTALSVGGSGVRELKLSLSRKLADFSSSVSTVMVKYNDKNYIEYRVNFDNGEYSKNQVFEIPVSMLYDPVVTPPVNSTPSTDNTPSAPSQNDASKPEQSTEPSVDQNVEASQDGEQAQ